MGYLDQSRQIESCCEIIPANRWILCNASVAWTSPQEFAGNVNALLEARIGFDTRLDRELDSRFSFEGSVEGTRNSLNAVHPLEHVNCYNRTCIIRIAEIAGLEEARISIGLQYSTNWSSVVPWSRTC
jgi:hypothetical protein